MREHSELSGTTSRHQHAREGCVAPRLSPALSAALSGVESRLLGNLRRSARPPRIAGPAQSCDYSQSKVSRILVLSWGDLNVIMTDEAE